MLAYFPSSGTNAEVLLYSPATYFNSSNQVE